MNPRVEHRSKLQPLLTGLVAASLAACLCAMSPGGNDDTTPTGPWLSWRGPHQNGTSTETDLPDAIELDGDNHLWSYELAGRGTPTIAGERVYAFGYEGEGPDLREVLVCLDAEDGSRIWEQRFSDFLSDVIYDRYSIGSPTVDPDSGDVYLLTTGGLFNCFSADGELRWQHSLMSEFGRLTFPNGRLGAALVVEDLVVIHVITSGWGPQGPARDRFLAFDKHSGETVWIATPGIGPKDSSFSYPVLADLGGRRVLIAGTGCGNIACIDARTGDTVWRYPVSIGGVNSSAVLYGDGLIAIHGKENLDSSTIGRMFHIPLAGELDESEGVAVLKRSNERWRNDLVAFTSSPVLVGDRVYQTVATGDLCCVDASDGSVLWKERLAPDQIHASPVAADGKLYVPMTNGTFHIVRPGDEGPELLDETQLAGSCLGAPAIGNGRIYVHTTEKLYCFGAIRPVDSIDPGPSRAGVIGELGAPVRLQVIPGELLVRPGETVPLRVRALDANGLVVDTPSDVSWNLGPLAASIDGEERLVMDETAVPGVAVIRAESEGLVGTVRTRVVPNIPFGEDFEAFELGPHPTEEGVQYAWPSGHWLGGRPKWDVREVDGSQVLAKTIDNNLFQRTFSLFGDPSMSNYVMQVDIMTEGNRRTMSSAGVIDQRYLIQLKGNHQAIEVSSNMERIKESVPFKWKANVWYTLKTRVDVAADGSGVVRAKAWPRDEPEPEAWNIEVPHKNAHTEGSPGLFGFSPQSRFRVYVDNLSVTPQ